MQYIELRESPPDPNRAKYWALGLCAVASLIALMTIKSNYDYFLQYYDGFALWARVVAFSAVEMTIITFPLFKGWGNDRQIRWALILDLALIVLSLTHTYLVGESTQAKIQAKNTKAEATADFERTSTAADKIAARNKELQDSYNRAMANYNRAAVNARASGEAPPSPPAAPQLLAVPQVKQETVDATQINVEQAAEAQVPHSFLLKLLYAMIAVVVIGWTAMVSLAHSVKIRDWLMAKRSAEIQRETRAVGGHHQVVDTGGGGQFPALSLPAPEPHRVAGFSPPKDTVKDTKKDTPKDTKPQTHEDCIGDDARLCLKTVRERLKSVSAHNPGVSFKVDGRGSQIFIRAMRAEQGSQVTAATLKLSRSEAQRLVEQSPAACANALVARFASQNLQLKS